MRVRAKCDDYFEIKVQVVELELDKFDIAFWKQPSIKEIEKIHDIT